MAEYQRALYNDVCCPECDWEEFKEVGLLWWINRMLHLFGWAIVFAYSEDGKLAKVYPARVKFRGFSTGVETEGFKRLSEYLENTIVDLCKELDD